MLTEFSTWLNTQIVETGAVAVYLPSPLYRAYLTWRGEYDVVLRVLRPHGDDLILFDITPTPPCPTCKRPLVRVTKDWHECARVSCTDKDTREYGGRTCVRVLYPDPLVPRIVRPKEA